MNTDQAVKMRGNIGPEDFGLPAEYASRAQNYANWVAATAWTPAATPPDADTTVLLALSDGEVWQGYLDGETWRDTSGMPIASARVTYWMRVPAHPEPEAKAAPIRTSTGFCCASCCAKAGEPHVEGCPESPAPATIQSWHTGLPLPGEPRG